MCRACPSLVSTGVGSGNFCGVKKRHGWACRISTAGSNLSKQPGLKQLTCATGRSGTQWIVGSSLSRLREQDRRVHRDGHGDDDRRNRGYRRFHFGRNGKGTTPTATIQWRTFVSLTRIFITETLVLSGHSMRTFRMFLGESSETAARTSTTPSLHDRSDA